MYICPSLSSYDPVNEPVLSFTHTEKKKKIKVQKKKIKSLVLKSNPDISSKIILLIREP